MPQTIKSRSRRVLELPAPQEDAAFQAGIAKNPDTCEPGATAFKQPRRGRPLGSGTKTHITLRLDTDVVNRFKASGGGWQTRINEALKSWVQSQT